MDTQIVKPDIFDPAGIVAVGIEIKLLLSILITYFLCHTQHCTEAHGKDAMHAREFNGPQVAVYANSALFEN